MPSPPPKAGGGWLFVPYIAESGKSEVQDWLTQLREDRFTDFVFFQETLRPLFVTEGPFKVGPPYWEGLGEGLYEVRFGRCRLYCSVEDARQIVMYRGVVKRWPKFDAKDRKFCERGREDFKSQEYDQEKRGYLYRDHCQKRSQSGNK